MTVYLHVEQLTDLISPDAGGNTLSFKQNCCMLVCLCVLFVKLFPLSAGICAEMTMLLVVKKKKKKSCTSRRSA